MSLLQGIEDKALHPCLNVLSMDARLCANEKCAIFSRSLALSSLSMQKRSF